MGRGSLLVRAGRLFQRLPLAWLRIIEAPFVYALSCGTDKAPMIVLLAIPRSGSTLTYQLIVESLHPVYLSNIANLLYQLPLLGGVLSSLGCRNYHSKFSSDNGFVSGLCGPAEGLKFWSYWLGYGVDERYSSELAGRLLKKRLGYLRRVMSLLSRAESPLVTGFLGHTLEPQRLQEEFPDALIVRLHREPLSNALSLLHSRRAAGRDWFSLFPRECENVIGEGEHAEVAAQVYWLNRRLEDATMGDNVFHLDYEALCKEPRVHLNELVNFCSARGVPVSLKGDIPEAFNYKVADIKADSDAVKLSSALTALESCYGQLSRWGRK